MCHVLYNVYAVWYMIILSFHHLYFADIKVVLCSGIPTLLLSEFFHEIELDLA